MTLAYGTRYRHASGGAVAPTDGDRTVAPSGPAPRDQAPAGDPDGALGHRSAADNGGPRHGDAHAVTPSHHVPLRLVPGAVVRAVAAGTRDRHRDIPLFPT